MRTFLIHLCPPVSHSGRMASVVAFLLTTSIAKGDRVDHYIRQEMERRHIPGVELAVLKDGKPVKFGYYGLANVEHSVPVKPETIFQIQSMTKSFVATAVMMLAEEGEIRLDEK